MAITRVQDWTVVQKTSGTGSTLDNVLATVPVAGNLLVAYVSNNSNGGAVSGLTLTDSIGDGGAWNEMTTNPIAYTSSLLNQSRGFYKIVGTPSGGAKTVNVTISGTQFLALFVAEYGDSGGVPTWSIDGSQISALGAAATGAPSAGSIIVSGTNTVILGFAQVESGTLAAGSGYISRATNNGWAKYLVEDRIETTAATYAVNLTTPTDREYVMSGIAFSATTGTPPPTVTTVTSSGATEAGNMVFTVSLSGTTSGSTNYAFIVDGTATAGVDFTSPLTSAMCSNSVTVSGGNFVVPNGVSGWSVTVPTLTDTADEDAETIVLTIGGTASTGGTITDDDAAPVITVADATQSGGTVTFTLTLTPASGKSVTCLASTANGAKTAGTHFTGITDQLVTFAAGETSKTVVVTVL